MPSVIARNKGHREAGNFAEGAAKAVATTLIASMRSGMPPVPHLGTGTCYIEFGSVRIGKVDVDFFSHEDPTGTYFAPSLALRADKEAFGSTRRARWFGHKAVIRCYSGLPTCKTSTAVWSKVLSRSFPAKEMYWSG